MAYPLGDGRGRHALGLGDLTLGASGHQTTQHRQSSGREAAHQLVAAEQRGVHQGGVGAVLALGAPVGGAPGAGGRAGLGGPDGVDGVPGRPPPGAVLDAGAGVQGPHRAEADAVPDVGVGQQREPQGQGGPEGVAERGEGTLVLVAHRQPEVTAMAGIDLLQGVRDVVVQGSAVGRPAGPDDVADDDDSRRLHLGHMKIIPSFCWNEGQRLTRRRRCRPRRPGPGRPRRRAGAGS